MKTSDIYTTVFIALGLLLGLGLMGLSTTNATPLFVECGVNVEC